MDFVGKNVKMPLSETESVVFTLMLTPFLFVFVLVRMWFIIGIHWSPLLTHLCWRS